MLHIQESKDEIIILNRRSNWLDESEQRELIVWFCKNKPELIREIFCEDCPEHIGELERKAYVMNECERGHKP